MTSPAIAHAPVLAAYPPPYRLTGTIACFPAAASAAAVAAATGIRPLALRGRTVITVLAADYRSVHYGPQRTLLTEASGQPYRYREFAWLAHHGAGWRLPVSFGRLWLDAPSPLPIEIGLAYGFPKVAGTFALADSDGAFSFSGPDAACIEAATSLRLPAWLARLTPSHRAVFPTTGHSATLAIAGASSCAGLRVRRWQVPWLAQLDARPLGWGLLLRDGGLYVGPPTP